MWQIAIAVMFGLALVALLEWSAVADSGKYQWLRSDRGAELVEFAVVVPMLAMVLIAMFWFARSFNIYETLTRVAREGAVYGARPLCALCGEPNCGELPPGFPCSGQIGDKLAPMLKADGIDPASLAVIPKPDIGACVTRDGINVPDNPCPRENSKPKAQCWSYRNEGRIWVCRCVDMLGGQQQPGTNGECGVSVTLAYPWKFPLPFTELSHQLFTIKASSQQRQEF